MQRADSSVADPGDAPFQAPVHGGAMQRWVQVRPRLCAVLLLVAFFAQAVSSAVVKAPTFDEEFHVARAFAYVRAGDLRMQQNHPPVVSALAGLPLLLMPELPHPSEVPGWDDSFLFTFADQLFWRLGQNVDRIIFLARLAIMLLGVLLGAVIFRWSNELYGRAAAVMAVGLFAFSPNLLAHTRLVTTDLAVSALLSATFYLCWRYLRRPSTLRLAAAGLSAGMALSAKTSALIIVPVIGVLFLGGAILFAYRRPSSAVRRLSAASALGRGAILFLIAGAVVWAFYGFEVRPWPGSSLPLPATTYLLNVRTVLGHAERGHAAFLMGRVSDHGWWYYFVVTFVLKTPLLTIGLLVVALWDSARWRRWADEAALLIFPAAYFVFALTSPLNIGYRYLLPIVPFLCIYAGKTVSLGWLRPQWLRHGLVPALLVAYAAVTLWLHPHYLAYFNLIAGGPWGGYRYLVDSNLDWGQDLKLLSTFLDERDVEEVWLGYFGTADPGYYGIRYRALFPPGSSRTDEDFAPIAPASGWYAISATVLQGPFSVETDVLDWFRRREPVARIGYSIFVYHVLPDPDPPSWVAVCYAPEPILSDQEVFRRVGLDGLRLVGFDCRSSWVVPAGGDPGLYVVPLDAEGRRTLAAEWVDASQIVFRERGLRGGPAFAVYSWGRSQVIGAMEWRREAWRSPELAPSEVDAQTQLPMPADLAGEVAFTGYRAVPTTAGPGDELILTTSWRVLARPADPALSLFAHLVGPEGVASVGDGLGFPAIQWLPGDVFYQRSLLTLPVEPVKGSYWAQIGLHSLASGQRLPVVQGDYPRSDRVADRLLLGPLWGGSR